ncbi:MAG: hypothetical protein ACRC54_05150 [Fusobacteriaceae bacterium]
MKYTISDVQQEKLIELGLDVKDAFLLSYIKDLTGAKKIIKKLINNETYYWIDYDNIPTYLPILGLNCVRTIGRRFTKYEELGLISKYIHKNFNHITGTVDGSYTFIAFQDKFQELFEVSKVKDNLKKMNDVAKKLGLDIEDNKINFPKKSSKPRGLKSPLMEKHSKVPSWRGTEKSAPNSPINYSPINNSSSSEEENKNRRRFIDDSFLNKNDFIKLNDFTKSNILKKLPKLETYKFIETYNKVLKAEITGDVKEFNGALYSALIGKWEFKVENNDSKILSEPFIQEKIIWFKTSFGALDHKSYLNLLSKISLETLKKNRKRLGRMSTFEFTRELKKLSI